MYESPWEQIDDFPDFAVSREGEILSLQTKHILTPRRAYNGTLIVNLTRDKQIYTRSLGVLVASHFKRETHNEIFDTVINLNGDRTDCHIDNLMWRPRWFAIRYHRQFRDAPLEFNERIYCVDTDDVFETCMDAAVQYGLLQADVFNDVVNQRGVWPDHYYFKLFRE